MAKIVKTCDVVDLFYQKREEAEAAGRSYNKEESSAFVNDLVWLLGETKPCGALEAVCNIFGRRLHALKRKKRVKASNKRVWNVEP